MFEGVVFCAAFDIYGAEYVVIWCSAYDGLSRSGMADSPAVMPALSKGFKKGQNCPPRPVWHPLQALLFIKRIDVN